MHLALCDDDGQSLAALIALVQQYKEQHCLYLSYEAFSSPAALLERMQKSHFDLLILDVVMPQKTGIDLAVEIRGWNHEIPIIFLTSAPEFAVASYRVQAQDYLLKPVDKTIFFVSLDRQIQRLQQQERRILIHTTRGMLQIPISSIVYLESTNRKLAVVQVDGTVTETTQTMSDMEQVLLQHPQFNRPHRSYLVNLHYVKSVEKDGLCTVSNAFIPVARGNMAKLRNQYMNTLLLDEQDEGGCGYAMDRQNT